MTVEERTSRLEFEYLIGQAEGIRRASEVHELGLFTRSEGSDRTWALHWHGGEVSGVNPIRMRKPYHFRVRPEDLPYSWMDEKGYGWVESGGDRFFAHIKEFDRGQRRPATGDEVRFIPGIDRKGRPCARRVTFVKTGKFRVSLGAWGLLCLLLVLPLLAMLWLPVPWWMSASGMLIVLAITCGLYGNDKKRAVTREWRLVESSLHLGELLGGWPGGFLAQRRMRHKCSKPSYQVVFWLIVLLYQIAAVDLMLNHQRSRAVIGLWNQ